MALQPVTAEAVTAEPASAKAGRDRRGRSPAEIVSEAAGRFTRLDLRNTWQVAAGSLLVPLGIVVVLIAWYGAAHASVVQQQVPYLVSGSFIGLGLMIVGGLLYWAHWLYRIYDQADLHHAERMARDQQIVDLLEAALSGGPGAGTVGGAAARQGTASRAETASTRAGSTQTVPTQTAGTQTAGTQTAGTQPAPARAPGTRTDLVATASDTNVHRPDCPIAVRHSGGLQRVTAEEAESRTPCRICQPFAD